MQHTRSSSLKTIQLNANYLWFITLSYTVVMLLSNWFDARLIHLFGLTTDAGTIIFPLTFILSDLITEVYGYKQARRAIWCGFLFNAVFILYGQLIIHLPSPDYPTNNALFDALLSTNMRIIIASTISYLCAEPINSIIMATLKIKTHGRFLGFRFIASTAIASLVDSFIFGYIAFVNVMSNDHLFSLILTMWLVKVLIEVMGLPISIYATIKLKQCEKLDIYDKGTQFSLFNLDISYPVENNEYAIKK